MINDGKGIKNQMGVAAVWQPRTKKKKRVKEKKKEKEKKQNEKEKKNASAILYIPHEPLNTVKCLR